MVLISGLEVIYVWFSAALLAWSLPNVSIPSEGIKRESNKYQESIQTEPQQGSWFKQQVYYVPKKDDWPVVVDPSLQPWRGNNNWN